jgi:predicted transposase YdaD
MGIIDLVKPFMRRDSIFYKLFQQSPSSLFELLTNRPENAETYRFDSVAVKEPKFEIDERPRAAERYKGMRE